MNWSTIWNQKERKNQGYDVTDRIELAIISDDEFVLNTVENFSSYIKNETLAIDLETKILSTHEKVHDRNAEVSISKLANDS